MNFHKDMYLLLYVSDKKPFDTGFTMPLCPVQKRVYCPGEKGSNAQEREELKAGRGGRVKGCGGFTKGKGKLMIGIRGGLRDQVQLPIDKDGNISFQFSKSQKN